MGQRYNSRRYIRRFSNRRVVYIEPTNFVLGTNTQQYNVHLTIQMKMTLTDDEGHRRRSQAKVKGHKIELMVISR